MGKFSQVDAGLITQCHACDFDLLNTQVVKPVIYDESAALTWMPALQMLEGKSVGARYDTEFFAVLHQMCKILLAHGQHVHLQKYVADKIGAPEIMLLSGNAPFENYSLEDRHVVIQLAMWLMADPEKRIVEAWRSKAVRFNMLNKDFKPRPRWYRDIVRICEN